MYFKVTNDKSKWNEFISFFPNEEKDIYRFDVKDLEKLKKHRSIVLKVNPKADLSQK